MYWIMVSNYKVNIYDQFFQDFLLGSYKFHYTFLVLLLASAG